MNVAIQLLSLNVIIRIKTKHQEWTVPYTCIHIQCAEYNANTSVCFIVHMGSRRWTEQGKEYYSGLSRKGIEGCKGLYNYYLQNISGGNLLREASTIPSSFTCGRLQPFTEWHFLTFTPIGCRHHVTCALPVNTQSAECHFVKSKS